MRAAFCCPVDGQCLALENQSSLRFVELELAVMTRSSFDTLKFRMLVLVFFGTINFSTLTSLPTMQREAYSSFILSLYNHLHLLPSKTPPIFICSHDCSPCITFCFRRPVRESCSIHVILYNATRRQVLRSDTCEISRFGSRDPIYYCFIVSHTNCCTASVCQCCRFKGARNYSQRRSPFNLSIVTCHFVDHHPQIIKNS